eukprot:TRINITY_DN9328_c0_g1_i11.p1 TRINITY_DN9328_c0_g1~~TRINITY_DN9328_c0_g1_i11.p1  ORF type:complete len:411 (+),score=103.20 TRINITY_DN9328_c0_g1_i11:119-1351(+)
MAEIESADREELGTSFLDPENRAPAKGANVVSTKLYWCSMIMGFAALEPWNEILSCMNYFQNVYKPDYQPQFTLPMIIFFPLVACQFLLIAYGKHFSMKLKIVTSMAILSFLVYAFLLICRCIENKAASFWSIIALTLIIGTFNGIVQSSVGGLVGAMGCEGKYMGANMTGNGLSGILANLLTFMCLGIIGGAAKDEFKSTMLFFMVMAVLMVGCVYTAYIMLEDPVVSDIVKNLPLEKPLKEIFKLTWPVFKNHGKNVFFTYICTFIVFPGVALKNTVTYFPKQWAVPFVIFIFNFFDTIGRFIPSYANFIKSKAVVWICLFRVIFVVSTFFIGFGSFNGLFVTDWWITVNMACFAFTNGLATSLTMMYGISEAEDKDREDAGKIMTVFLTGGIFIGSLLAQLVSIIGN